MAGHIFLLEKMKKVILHIIKLLLVLNDHNRAVGRVMRDASACNCSKMTITIV